MHLSLIFLAFWNDHIISNNPLCLLKKEKIPLYIREKIDQRNFIANEAMDAGDLDGMACSEFLQ